MKIQPRADWRKKLESLGFLYHDGENPYWNESVCYEFSMAEIDRIEESTNQLHEICIQTVETVIQRDWFARMSIPPLQAQLAVDSWNQDERSIYGRFDLTLGPGGQPKMLEYNADTPTSLFETAIVQWDWLEEAKPGFDQFNSLHERLIKRWQEIADKTQKLHFFCQQNQLEDLTQTEYLRDTAHQSGFQTEFLFLEDLGWDSQKSSFVDLEDQPVTQAFKLYPWEWLLMDSFGTNLKQKSVHWIEPAWKSILSNKALLPLLWELYPNHPALLPAYFEKPDHGQFVQKPFVSREGAQIKILDDGYVKSESGGAIESKDFIFQAYQELPTFEGRYVVLGSWVIGEEAGGMGIREDVEVITGPSSQFVPHFINARRGS